MAVLVVAGGVVALSWPDDQPPAYEIRQIEGFPEYAKGARVVAADSTELPSKTLGFSVVPKSPDMRIIVRCDLKPTKYIKLLITVGGRAGLSADCDTPPLWDAMLSPDRYELVVGQEVSITADLNGYGIPVAQGSFGVAVVEPVPAERYPYPPRPETLAELRPGSGLGNLHVRSGGPLESTFTWKEGVVFYIRINTPGTLRVLLDGKPADECESWDYQAQFCTTAKINGEPLWRPHRPAAGKQVTVTVVTQGTTGDWEVGMDPY